VSVGIRLRWRNTPRMSEEEANQRAKALNVELGSAGEARRFYVAEEVRPGQWDAVEHRSRLKSGWWQRILQNLPGNINT
jgi:hypothetical protein